MDFKEEGPWNTEKYCWKLIGQQEKILNSKRSIMAKIVAF